MREKADERIKTSVAVSDGVAIRLHDSGEVDDPFEGHSGFLYNNNNKS